MNGPAAETGRVTTPSATYVLDVPPPALTDWHVAAEVRCPGDCGLYIDFDGPLDDLVKLTALHRCEVAGYG